MSPAKAKPLRWRKPTDHPQDNEDALWVADGIGGRYSITDQGDHVLLWMAEDNFAWQRFATVMQAKDAAEVNWQREFAKRLLEDSE